MNKLPEKIFLFYFNVVKTKKTIYFVNTDIKSRLFASIRAK